MQYDYRNYYLDDTLKATSYNYRNFSGIKTFTTGGVFNARTREQVMLDYMAAKHAVKNWYSIQKLNKLKAI